ncbi:MAG: hypothetical protein ACOC1T_02140 [Halorhodospira sp.]
MSSGNPASRLLEIAQAAKEMKEGISARDGWSAVLDAHGSRPLLMTRMGEAMMLIEKALDELNLRFPEQYDTHRHWVAKVSAAFLADGNGGAWKGVQQHFDAHTINYLTLASNLLDQPRGGEAIRPEQVVSMKERLEVFLEEVGESAMGETSKEVIRHHVGQILEALDERGINSREAVEDAVHMTMGKAAMDQEVRKDLAKSGMGERLQNAMAFVYQTVTAAKDAGQLLETMRRLLSEGG